MKQLDIPNLPDELFERIERRARETGRSLAEQAAEILARGLSADEAEEEARIGIQGGAIGEPDQLKDQNDHSHDAARNDDAAAENHRQGFHSGPRLHGGSNVTGGAPRHRENRL